MVRSTHYLRIIEQECLVDNAGKVGAYFLDQLRDLLNGRCFGIDFRRTRPRAFLRSIFPMRKRAKNFGMASSTSVF